MFVFCIYAFHDLSIFVSLIDACGFVVFALFVFYVPNIFRNYISSCFVGFGFALFYFLSFSGYFPFLIRFLIGRCCILVCLLVCSWLRCCISWCRLLIVCVYIFNEGESVFLYIRIFCCYSFAVCDGVEVGDFSNDIGILFILVFSLS